MFSRKKKGSLASKLFIVFIIALFIYGYALNESNIDYLKNMYSKNDNNQLQEGEENNENNENNEIYPSSNSNNSTRENNQQKVITLDTKFICKTYDKENNDIRTDEIALPNELINMSIEEAKKYINDNYGNWIINEINDKYIEVYKTSEEVYYEPYYLIKESGGKVYVFEFDETGEKKMVQETGINFDLLRETDQELFKNGVVKYDMNEVLEILQDFES